MKFRHFDANWRILANRAVYTGDTEQVRLHRQPGFPDIWSFLYIICGTNDAAHVRNSKPAPVDHWPGPILCKYVCTACMQNLFGYVEVRSCYDDILGALRQPSERTAAQSQPAAKSVSKGPGTPGIPR